MWRLGIILLIYGVQIQSLQCPERCYCVETEVMFNSSRPDYDIIDVSESADNISSAEITHKDIENRVKRTTSVVEVDKNPSNGSSLTASRIGNKVLSYQITCDGLRQLKSVWLEDLPDPTTQLILRHSSFYSIYAFHKILKDTNALLPNITDLSITKSVIGTEKSFRPFASMVNPIPKAKLVHRIIERETDCKHLQILNLSNNSLTYLPAGLFSSFMNLQTLDLSDNLIKNFEDEIFHPLINLLRLDLHRNRLKSLNEAVFRNLTRLLTLDVSENDISSVAPSTFQYLASVNTLILAGNPLSTILVLLGTGKRLQIVDVSRTGLRQIPGTLERSVRSLDLHGNLLTSIQCGDLDSYSLLSILVLNRNRISYIEDDAMGRLELLTNLQVSNNKLFQVPKSLPDNLEILNLSYNLIQNITNSDFLNLSLLKELYIGNNQIQHVEENSFVNLLNLQTLDLSRNPILLLPQMYGLAKLRVLNLSYFTNVSKDWRHVYRSFPTPSPGNIEVLSLESSPMISQVFLEDTNTLQMYTNLQKLYIRFANLTTLRKDIYSLLPSLTVLQLEGNPWHCDKEMLVTALWLRKHGKNEFSSDENQINTMHCATPPQLNKKPLITLTSQDFGESSEIEKVNTLNLFKNQSSFKRPKLPSANGIYFKSYGNSVENSTTQINTNLDSMKGGKKGFVNAGDLWKQLFPTSAPVNMSANVGNGTTGIAAALNMTDVQRMLNVTRTVTSEFIQSGRSCNPLGVNATATSGSSSCSTGIVNVTVADEQQSSDAPISSIAITASPSAPDAISQLSTPSVTPDITADSVSPTTEYLRTDSASKQEKIHNFEDIRSDMVSSLLRSGATFKTSLQRATTTSTVPIFHLVNNRSTPELSLGPTNKLVKLLVRNLTNEPTHLSQENASIHNNPAVMETLSFQKQENMSHPGLFIMIFVGVLLAAALAMTFQQVTRSRREVQGYRLQGHEMEVHSISSPANDLW